MSMSFSALAQVYAWGAKQLENGHKRILSSRQELHTLMLQLSNGALVIRTPLLAPSQPDSFLLGGWLFDDSLSVFTA